MCHPGILRSWANASSYKNGNALFLPLSYFPPLPSSIPSPLNMSSDTPMHDNKDKRRASHQASDGPSTSKLYVGLAVSYSKFLNFIFRKTPLKRNEDSLEDDIHQLAELLSPQSAACEDTAESTQPLVTRIAMTLQKENNALLFVHENTTTTLIMCLQTVSSFRRCSSAPPEAQSPTHSRRHLLSSSWTEQARTISNLSQVIGIFSVDCS